MKNPFWSRFVNACIWSIKWEHQNFIRANKVKCIGSIGKVGKNYTKLSQICVTIKWYCGFINFRRKAKKFIQICLYVIFAESTFMFFLNEPKKQNQYRISIFKSSSGTTMQRTKIGTEQNIIKALSISDNHLLLVWTCDILLPIMRFILINM